MNKLGQIIGEGRGLGIVEDELVNTAALELPTVVPDGGRFIVD